MNLPKELFCPVKELDICCIGELNRKKKGVVQLNKCKWEKEWSRNDVTQHERKLVGCMCWGCLLRFMSFFQPYLEDRVTYRKLCFCDEEWSHSFCFPELCSPILGVHCLKRVAWFVFCIKTHSHKTAPWSQDTYTELPFSQKKFFCN